LRHRALNLLFSLPLRTPPSSHYLRAYSLVCGLSLTDIIASSARSSAPSR
jgi:hypothetical protein